MGQRRLQFDLLHAPYILSDGSSNSPAEAPDAKVLNIGTTANPITFASSGNVVNVRAKSTHASGDARSIYNRLLLYGAGGGEASRNFTSVMANLGTAHGQHNSLNFAAEAGGSECSGLGVACRNTLHIPNVASWAPTGTLSAVQAEIYSDGAASDPAGLTELSFLRFVSDGNAAGKADVDTDAVLMSIQGLASAADLTKVITTASLAELNTGGTIGIKIKVGTGTYFIPAVAAASWN